MKTFLKFFFLLSPLWIQAQQIEATVLANWDDESITPAFFDNPYHDVWGAVVDDVEYGIISSTDGFHFFNLSGDGSNMEPVAFVEGTAQGSNISHRDFKVYQNYLYAVADEGPSALQVFDMSVLPDNPTMVYESNQFVTRCHNMYIDQDNARLYLVGGNGFNLRVLSLEDPENPILLASFPNAQLNIPYIHDLYVRDNIGYLNAAFDGLMVVDFNDPSNATVLGTMTNYIQQGYNHSGWLSDDGNYYYMCDETHGTDIKIVDVSDFTDISVVSTMNAASTQNQIVHNVYLQGNLLYASYYYDGLQVFDVSNPNYPRRVAYYDTSVVPNTSYFAGAWGVFVLPSGKSLISDMQNGFYVFEPLDLPDNTFATPSVPQLVSCPGEELNFNVWIGPNFDGETVTLSVEDSAPELDVTLGETEVAPGDEVSVSVTANGSGTFDLVILADDGDVASESVIPIAVAEFPPASEPLAPTDGRENVNLAPFFFWANIDQSALGRRLEISTNFDDFEDNIIHTQTVFSNSYTLGFDLEEGTTYYWRIVSSYACGDNPSVTFTFTTKVVTSVSDLGGNKFTLAPNPANNYIDLRFDQLLSEDLQVELRQINGQQIQAATLLAGTNKLNIDLQAIPAGMYLLRISNANTSVTQKVIVQ